MKKELKCVEFKLYWDWWMFDRKGMKKNLVNIYIVMYL